MNGSRVATIFAAVIVLICAVPMALIWGYLWLFRDEEAFTAGCGGGSRSGTCHAGETGNMIAALSLGAVALVALAVVIVTVTRARSEKPDRVRRDGTRVPGVLVRLQNGATGLGEAFYDLRFEGSRPEGGLAVATVRARHPLPDRTPVTLAYHPRRPEHAVVVDDLDRLGATALDGASA